jgi:hypothetical protein
MQDIEVVTPSSKKAREYKSKTKLATSDPSIIQKTLKYPTRAQKQQDIEIDEVLEEGYETPI